MDNLSYCITIKNRAELLDMNLDRISRMNYDLKRVEVVITDGNSTDNLLEVLKKHYKKFYQIKYAISDRDALPFKVVSNNPAADRNSMVANLPTFEKCIMTDPEIMFCDDDELINISNYLEDKNAMIWYRGIRVNQGFKYNFDGKVSDWDNHIQERVNGTNGFCNCINKSLYLDVRGYDEKFCLGFAAEDSHFIHWCEKNKGGIRAQNYVLHLWHKEPNFDGRYKKIYDSYTSPLYKKMLKENTQPNEGNPDWKRPEMIKDIKIFKE